MKDQGKIGQLLKKGLQHHQAGRLVDAAQLYQKILGLNPSQADALHLLGMLHFQGRQIDTAINLVQKAIAVNPKEPSYHSNLGTLFQAEGKLSEAQQEYEQALRLSPKQPEILANLGSVLKEQQKLNQAANCFVQAISIKPDFPELHFHLGATLQAQGKFSDAITCYENALELRSNYAEAICNIGCICMEQKNLDEAISRFNHALAIKPNLAEAHNGLGAAFFEKKNYELATKHYEEALALRHSYVEALSNYGTLLEVQGRLEEAIARHTQALAIRPDYAEAHNSIGNALAILGKLDEAIPHFTRALTLNPNLTEAYGNLAVAQLRAGDFASGWKNYEWRWHSKKSQLSKRIFSRPQWYGEPLNGAKILIHAEQGLGDTLQFLRYVPMVHARGGTVILAVQETLSQLAAGLPGVSEVIPSGSSLPQFDVHCPLMSLPLVFGTTLDTIPARIPYLSVPPESQTKAAAFPWPDKGLRVGLVWAGNPVYCSEDARYRSISFSQLSPILKQEGVNFFSLQVGEAAAEMTNTAEHVTDLMAHMSNMSDTAALIACLDLVITVDTSVAHLAGALGKPTWVMLPFASEWRWLMEREDSPWYPTIQLFRKHTLGSWDPVIDRVCKELQLKTEQMASMPSR